MAATLRCLFACLLGLAMQLPAFAQTVPASRNEAGIIDLVEGGVTVTGPDRRGRAVRKGDALFEGDSIVTAADGELHANLTDGGVVAVRPNTQLRITRYQANGDAGDTSIFNLVKGSFRSITGWIARTNPAGYQIRTTTSTIGVRGTDHEPLVIAPGSTEGEPGTYDRVHAGTSFIRGGSGTVDVAAGRAGFFAHHGRDRPRMLDAVPGFFRASRNERLLEGRHERVRQVLEQRREERRKLIQERRAQRQEQRRAGEGPRAGAAGPGRPGEVSAPPRADAAERNREARERAAARRADFEARREQHAAGQEARREALQQQREARQRERELRQGHREGPPHRQ